MVKAMAVLAALGALGALVGGQLAFGGSSQAASWTVWVGEQKKAPAGTPKMTSLNQYFPGRLTVNAGDKVTFSSVGFHTVTYQGGKPVPAFLTTPQGEVYADIADSAGQPFFFNGEQKFAYNVPHFAPSGPKTISRGTFASSGAIFAQKPNKPVSATYAFPQTGKFKLLCNFHPGMEMVVDVKPKGASVPATPEEILAKAQADTAAAWASAKALVAQKPPVNTIYMGVDGRKQSGGRTTVLDFVPNLTTVKAGATVKFVVAAPSEAHNAAFGSPKYLEKLVGQVDLFPGPPNSPNQLNPFFIYGSDPPGTPFEGGTMHGNGFYSTPLADLVKGPAPELVPGHVHEGWEVPLHLHAPRA